MTHFIQRFPLLTCKTKYAFTEDEWPLANVFCGDSEELKELKMQVSAKCQSAKIAKQ